MKLLKIELKNIGPYIDNTIDFNTTADKNIVLICGENGAGKTTLQKSIKLGLYGSFLYGLKHQSKSNTYVSEIRSIINNDSESGSIKLVFSIVEEYIENIYELTREWTLKPSFKENVELKVNNDVISKEEFLNKIEYINRYFNPKLIDTMMFDGEKVTNFIDHDRLEDFLEENIIYSFGLNYYVDLIKDLDKYIADMDLNSGLTVEQIKLKGLEKLLKTATRELSILNDKLDDFKEAYDKSKFDLDSSLQEFAQLGGLREEEFIELSQKLKSLDQEKEIQISQMKYFFENDLFFKLDSELLRDVKKQIELEMPYRYSTYLKEIIDSSLLSKSEENELNNLLTKFTKKENKSILSVKSSEDSFFDSLEKYINDASKEYNQIVEFIDIDDQLITDMRKRITLSQQGPANKLLDKIKKQSEELEKSKQEIKETKIGIENKQVEIESITKQIDEYKEVVYGLLKTNDSFVLAHKYKDICKKYYDSELSKNLSAVSKMVTSILKMTYRKTNFITKVVINSDFHIDVYCEEQKKDLKQLSAGEKQIFIAALMVSIIRCSKRNMPLIFDTPAGRLDNQHMSRFFRIIMAKAGSQVIIMPTSKEINDEVIKSISNRIIRCYTLEYQKDGTTLINKNRIFERKWES